MSVLTPPLDAASEGDTEAQRGSDTGLLTASSGLEDRLLQRPKSKKVHHKSVDFVQCLTMYEMFPPLLSHLLLTAGL